jgi:serine/threonine protein kinase
MLITLRDCHAAGFVHGDFKPSNIMVNNSRIIKLIDWDDTAFDPKYARSDTIASRRSRKERDLFAYSVSAFELIVGFLPDVKKLFIPTRIENPARDFISEAFKLVDSPSLFYSTLLNHPYLNQNRFKD